jgi:hypothetical protein
MFGSGPLHEVRDEQSSVALGYRNTLVLTPRFPFVDSQRRYETYQQSTDHGLNILSAIFHDDFRTADFTFTFFDGQLQCEGTCAVAWTHYGSIGHIPMPEYWDAINAVCYDRSGSIVSQVVDGNGKLIFVNENNDIYVVVRVKNVQRIIPRFLEALADPARVTYVVDPPENGPVRQALEQQVDVDFDQATLKEVVDHLAEQTGIPVELDAGTLVDDGITPETEVSLHLTGHRLKTVLRHLLQNVSGVKLTAIPRDGLLLVTSVLRAEELISPVVMEISDILRVVSYDDMVSLIVEHTSGPWPDSGGVTGDLHITPHGCLVFSQTEPAINEVIELIDEIRRLLDAPKPDPPKDPETIETRRYRLADSMAEDLMVAIPQLIAPESWKSFDDTAPGVIVKVRVEPSPAEPFNVGTAQFQFEEPPKGERGQVEGGEHERDRPPAGPLHHRPARLP